MSATFLLLERWTARVSARTRLEACVLRPCVLAFLLAFMVRLLSLWHARGVQTTLRLDASQVSTFMGRFGRSTSRATARERLGHGSLSRAVWDALLPIPRLRLPLRAGMGGARVSLLQGAPALKGIPGERHARCLTPHWAKRRKRQPPGSV
eukprot:6213777-Pleurochrysis_carterae.AAC.2